MTTKIPIWLTRREQNRLIAQAENRPRDRAILLLFLYSGLRCNELRMLDVADVDFDEGTVFVRFGKRAKQRYVPLHDKPAAALREYLRGRSDGPLFKSNRLKRISLRRLRSLVEALSDGAGLGKSAHPHALRHSFAVNLLENDVDLETIRELLGHESIATTSIYLHCTPSRLRSAVSRL